MNKPLLRAVSSTPEPIAEPAAEPMVEPDETQGLGASLRQMRQAGFSEHASPRTLNRSSLASRLPKDVQEALEKLRRGQ